jgi:hypothetical protein
MKQVRKKSPKISEAIFRGKKSLYSFEVFPLSAELEESPGIYVISKRITDKRGKGHHAFVCIGQTDSILSEIKKHQKGKCVKQNAANVICLLKEADAKNREKIEADLKAAHSTNCNYN